MFDNCCHRRLREGQIAEIVPNDCDAWPAITPMESDDDAVEAELDALLKTDADVFRRPAQ